MALNASEQMRNGLVRDPDGRAIQKDSWQAAQPVESAARTVNGTSAEQTGYGAASSLRVQLDVTAATGSLDVVIEDSLDGVNWNTVGTFAQKTAAGREVINITTPFADRLRVRWTIGGVTPSFTFAVDWHARG